MRRCGWVQLLSPTKDAAAIVAGDKMEQQNSPQQTTSNTVGYTTQYLGNVHWYKGHALSLLESITVKFGDQEHRFDGDGNPIMSPKEKEADEAYLDLWNQLLRKSSTSNS